MTKLITIMVLFVSLLFYTGQTFGASPCACIDDEFMMGDCSGCDTGCSRHYWYCLIPGHKHPAGKPCPVLGHCLGHSVVGQQLGLGSAGAGRTVANVVDFCANQPPLLYSQKNINAAKRQIKNSIYNFREAVSSITLPSIKNHTPQASVSNDHFASHPEPAQKVQSGTLTQNQFGGGSPQQYQAPPQYRAEATIPMPVGPPPHGALDGIFAVQKYQRVQPMVLEFNYPSVHGLPPGYVTQGYAYLPGYSYPPSYVY